MEAVSLGLAIPPTIDLCLKYGRELKTLCSSLRHADNQLSERIVRLDYGWLRWSKQLEFLKKVEHAMDDDHREVYAQVLEVFLSKLKVVARILSGLIEPVVYQPPPEYDDNYSGPTIRRTQSTDKEAASIMDWNCDVAVSASSRKIKYALKKNSLDKAIDDLESWQRTADHSWFLLMTTASPAIDAAIPSLHGSAGSALQSSVLAIRDNVDPGDNGVANAPSPDVAFGVEELAGVRTTAIPYSDARLGWRDDSGTSCCILNDIVCSVPDQYHIVKKSVRDLARRLQHTDPEAFGLLTCHGFVVDDHMAGPQPQDRFIMMFKVPTTFSAPLSFRDILLNHPQPACLSTRFNVAKELAKSVSYVHSLGFVHKGIHPESILSFKNSSGGPSLILTSFEHFRHEDGATRRAGDDVLSKNLYRHPSRQGLTPRQDYIMQHDIYSLGVCLLEIGLWQSFIVYRDGPDSKNLVSPALEMEVREDSTTQVLTFLEMKGKDHFVNLARTRLRRVMGLKYSEVVETCLTCLDPNNSDFGDEREFLDEDGIRVGVRYIEKVLLRLDMLYV